MKPASQPPRLAVRLLRLLASEDSVAPMLGDLQEEFRLRASASPDAAVRWFWRQVLASAWPLARCRLSASRTGQWLTAALAAVLLYVWIVGWDIWIARTGAGWAARGRNPDDLLLVRLIYFHVYLFGAVLGGALVTRFGWLPGRSFRSNSLRLLLPLAFILLWVLLDRLQSPGGQSAWAYLAGRAALTLPAVLLGAALAAAWRQRAGLQ